MLPSLLSTVTGATVLPLLKLKIGSRSILQLAHIICAFPQLQTLVISLVWTDNASIPPGLHLSPHLTALQPGRFNADSILIWLTSHPTCPALCTVSLCPRFSNGI